MNDSREALQSRFRATLQARVRDLRELLELLECMSSDPEAVQRVLGEVHTLKGEARILGMVELSDVAHGIEEHFRCEDSPDLSCLLEAVDAMDYALAESTPADEGRRRLTHARASLPGASGSVGDEAPSRPSMAPESVHGEESSIEEGPADAGHSPAGTRDAQDSRRWVQVDAGAVDTLSDRMGQLAAEFGRLNALAASSAEWGLDPSRQRLLRDQVSRCQSVIDGCSTTTWGLRLTPVEPTLRELSRHAERLASGAGKAVTSRIDSGNVQLERDVVERIWDSLLHLVQNAVDHGLEPASHRDGKPEVGVLRLGARTSGSSVVIEVEDDGRGIDVIAVRAAARERGLLSAEQAESCSDDDALQMIFEHGFSTRSEVSHLSGRGVGLDVVKRRVQGLGGHVRVYTETGSGTRFSLHVPHAMTRERVLITQLGDTLYGIPSRAVLAVLGARDLPPADSPEAHVLRYKGEVLPLRSLSDALSLSDDAAGSAGCIVELGGRHYALRLGPIVGEEELIRRPAEPLLARVGGVAGSAIREDGRLVLLLDFGSLERSLRGPRRAVAIGPVRGKSKPQRVLVVDDSPVVREMVSELLSSVGLEVVAAPNGVEALETIEREIPDLVLSDLEMPKMNGFELLEQVRSRSQRLPVVMLTTRGSEEDQRRAATLGANAYVLKTDFHSAALIDVVSRFVRVN